MKSCINEVVEIIAADVKSRKIEIRINIEEDVPDQIACDVSKLKQILLNLLLQNFNGQFRITISIDVSLRQTGGTSDGSEPYIMIDMECSKSDAKQKEIHRLNRLAAEKDFAKILESKCDLNYKIAKILTNAVGWRLSFNSFRQGRQTLMIPARKFIDKNKKEPEEPVQTVKQEGPKIEETPTKEEDPNLKIDD